MIKRVLTKILKLEHPVETVISLQTNSKIKNGNALVSYIKESAKFNIDSSFFDEHSNKWESRAIINILLNLGFNVDVIDWSDTQTIPSKEYEVLFDIDKNLQRIAAIKDIKYKHLHLTGSYYLFQNQAELDRVKRYEERTKSLYTPKRLVSSTELSKKSLEIADYCTLLGNDVTFDTYPAETREKISKLNATFSKIDYSKKTFGQKGFLFYSGSGAVHKGLDLVLDYFGAHPEYKLDVVGYFTEPDFLRKYSKLLYETDNIKYHGHLNPNQSVFEEIANRCDFILSLSCSEGMSTSVLTCMAPGLIPIVSLNTGVDIDPDTGFLFKNVDDIFTENLIQKAYQLDGKEIERRSKIISAQTRKKYSRENFILSFSSILKEQLEKRGMLK